MNRLEQQLGDLFSEALAQTGTTLQGAPGIKIRGRSIVDCGIRQGRIQSAVGELQRRQDRVVLYRFSAG